MPPRGRRASIAARLLVLTLLACVNPEPTATSASSAPPTITALSTDVASALTRVTISGSGFDSSVVVRFHDDRAFQVDIQPDVRSSAQLLVTIPPYVDAATGAFGDAVVNVAVLRHVGTRWVGSESESRLHIVAPPTLSAPAGTTTLSVLQAAISLATQHVQDVEGTQLDSPVQHDALVAYVASLSELAAQLSAIVSGQANAAQRGGASASLPFPFAARDLSGSDRLLVDALTGIGASASSRVVGGANVGGSATCMIGEANQLAQSATGGSSAQDSYARAFLFAVRESSGCGVPDAFTDSYGLLTDAARVALDLMTRDGTTQAQPTLPALALLYVTLSTSGAVLATGGTIAQTSCDAYDLVRARVRALDADAVTDWDSVERLYPQMATSLRDVIAASRMMRDVLFGSASPADCRSLSLGVEPVGDGGGVTTLSPPGGAYLAGRIIHLTAEPDSESTFDGWDESSACAGTDACRLAMSASQTVRPRFSKKRFSITTSMVGAGRGTVAANPSQPTYRIGTVVTITATPNAGSTFTGWAGDCAGTGPCQLVMNSQKNVVATFGLRTYTLTTTTNGTGSGTIAPSPAGSSFAHGTVVTLTATASAGSSFAGWTGACSGTGTCSVTMDADKSVTATFTGQSFNLTMATGGAGSGIMSASPAGPAYPYHTVVTVTATANTGSVFSSWSGACTGTGACTVTMDSNSTVIANFALRSYSLTTNTIGTGSGTVTASPVGPTYAFGTPVTLTGTPASGSMFAGWSGACSGTGTCSITMDSDKSVVASFNLAPRTLTTTTAGNGSGTISASPPGPSYPNGTSVTLTATPAVSSTFTGWSGACTGTGTCTLTMDADKSVTANFALKTFTLTLGSGGAGSGTVAANPTGPIYTYGSVVAVTATAAAGSAFAGWSGACSGTGACSVTMDADKSVTASFNLALRTLTTTTAGNGSGTISASPPGPSYPSGTSVTLTATPAVGSTFTGWSGACTGTGTCTLTMDADKSVTATFTLTATPFDGSYTGTFIGTATSNGFSYGMRGPVAFTILNGNATVTAPGTGTGSITPGGSGTFTSASGTLGTCTLSGSFTIASGRSTGSGSYTCTYRSGTSTGTWTATR